MTAPSTTGELEKLQIDAFKTAKRTKEAACGSFTVMFNPASYAIKYEIEYEDEQGKGTTALPQTFKRVKPVQFSLDFVLDGTGASGASVEVSDRVREFLDVVHRYQGEEHRPPFLRIAWGTLLVDCVFRSADIQYTLFRADGSPLRAKITASFEGSIDDSKRVKVANDSSPDRAHLHLVEAGDTLPLLAHRYYRDQRLAPAVADFNQLDHLRPLTPGQELMFPRRAKGGRRG